MEQWSRWEKHYLSYNNISCEYFPSTKDIVSLTLNDGAGNSYFSFTITNYQRGMKHCEGIVEYYTNRTYPNAEAIAKSNHFVIPNYRTDVEPARKKTARAKINIVNKGRKPETFNIWFDNIGIAIDVQNIYWK